MVGASTGEQHHERRQVDAAHLGDGFRVGSDDRANKDGETYHYVDFNFYVAYEENGQRGYVVGDPEIGAQTDELPDGATTVEEDGVTYYQFDNVFFEEVEADDGVYYEILRRHDPGCQA